jgi:hypothetical protein
MGCSRLRRAIHQNPRSANTSGDSSEEYYCKELKAGDGNRGSFCPYLTRNPYHHEIIFQNPILHQGFMPLPCVFNMQVPSTRQRAYLAFPGKHYCTSLLPPCEPQKGQLPEAARASGTSNSASAVNGALVTVKCCTASFFLFPLRVFATGLGKMCVGCLTATSRSLPMKLFWGRA